MRSVVLLDLATVGLGIGRSAIRQTLDTTSVQSGDATALNRCSQGSFTKSTHLNAQLVPNHSRQIQVGSKLTGQLTTAELEQRNRLRRWDDIDRQLDFIVFQTDEMKAAPRCDFC